MHSHCRGDSGRWQDLQGNHSERHSVPPGHNILENSSKEAEKKAKVETVHHIINQWF